MKLAITDIFEKYHNYGLIHKTKYFCLETINQKYDRN